MIPHKLQIRSIRRQSVFIILSIILIIMIVTTDYLPIPESLHIALEFFPFTILIIWFDLWFNKWGRVWIFAVTLLIVGSHIPYYPFFQSGLLFLGHIIFLLAMMFLFDQREKQKLDLHQRHLKTMRALLRQNPPLIQTVDYTQEAVMILDNSGYIIDLNSQTSCLLSLSESSMIGKPVFEVLDILPNFKQTSISENGEFAWKTNEGTTRQIKFRTQLLLMNDIPSGTLLTLSDISDAKKILEESLQSEKLSIISQVSGGLAHEIRNPLTTIKGFMQLITPEQWPESFRPYQQLILDEIHTIDQLINNFILLTSPSAPHIVRLNLVEAIPAMSQTIQPLIHKRGVTLVFEFPSHSVYVMGDREQLLQALLSILKNAIEASPKGGKVIIRLTEEDLCIRINIIDDGPGIPENLRHRILDPFFTTHKGGTGLGLTIAHQIILTHHGKLHFSESSSSSGTIVTIDFPSLSDFTNSLSA